MSIKCEICLDACVGEEKMCTLQCGHLFHVKCLSAWHKNKVIKTCAKCRKEFTGVIRLFPTFEEPSNRHESEIAKKLNEIKRLEHLHIERKKETTKIILKHRKEVQILNMEIAKLKHSIALHENQQQ